MSFLPLKYIWNTWKTVRRSSLVPRPLFSVGAGKESAGEQNPSIHALMDLHEIQKEGGEQTLYSGPERLRPHE